MTDRQRKSSAVATILRHGGVGILPTDTLYGLVGQALSKPVVARIYLVKRRKTRKPLIILINGLGDLQRFGMQLDTATRQVLNRVWPGKVSVILPCPAKRFAYLHRGAKTLAFRWPRSKLLEKIIRQTGPLVAPSANPEGRPPAKTIRQAKKYFGDQIDFYLAGGRRTSPSSTLISLEHGKIKLLRSGAVSLMSLTG